MWLVMGTPTPNRVDKEQLKQAATKKRGLAYWNTFPISIWARTCYQIIIVWIAMIFFTSGEPRIEFIKLIASHLFVSVWWS